MANPMDRITLARRMDTVDDVSAFLRDCVVTLGLGFHPDTRGAEYVTQQRTPSFTATEAVAFDALMARAFHVAEVAGHDVYELAEDLPEWQAQQDAHERVLLDALDVMVGQRSGRLAGAAWWPPLSS